MVDKDRVLIIGDIHISDRYTGRHVDYLENCWYCLDLITKSIVEKGITHLICLGDWTGIGLAEKNLKQRENLLKMMTLLQKWNKLLNGNVYSLKGNHDMGKGLTDYDIYENLGLVKNVKQLDLRCARFHMFNYGEENRQIEVDEDKYNVGCFHANLLIEGLTTWYRGGVGVELSTLDNLYGISLAVAGHIHNPSQKMVSTSIKDKDISLFYPGNLTRPKYEPNLWESAYGMVLDVDDIGVVANTITYELKPVSEVFTSTYADIEDTEEEGIDTTFDIEALSSILEELQYYNISGGQDYQSQIMRVAGLDKVAAELALGYIEKVETSFKQK